MNSITSYLIYMIKCMLIVLPICFIVRSVYLKLIHKRSTLHHEIGFYLFITFIIALASITILPSANSERIHENNLIPFKVMVDTYNFLSSSGNMNYFLINFVGNIVIFIPIGFMIPLLWNISGKKVILIGFCSSLFIEITQMFLARCSDIDDILLNTMGTILGLSIYKVLYYKFNIINKFRYKGESDYEL